MRIRLIKGDITKVEAGAIVNAANTSLLGGGGVDGAIHRAGGPKILEACREIRNRQGGCAVGKAVYTPAGDLNAQVVIHTVGPKWNNDSSNEAEKLASCYRNSLELADSLESRTIAFPNISTGIYRYPKIKAAVIAVETISEFAPIHLTEVVFVCFDDENYRIYESLLADSPNFLR
ncbi:MAG: O-acetyl-ADP-ribose deacetylase [Flavobacteriales bacterium]|nr:O-acetyl-ADP-ribose deacetylase [Flavobacteriales bacterium]